MIDKYDVEKLRKWLKLAQTKGTDAIKITSGKELNTYKVTVTKEGETV